MKKGSAVEKRIRSTVKAEIMKKGKKCGMKWRKGCVGRQRKGKEGTSAGESGTQTVLFSRYCGGIDHRSLPLISTASPLHCFPLPFFPRERFLNSHRYIFPTFPIFPGVFPTTNSQFLDLWMKFCHVCLNFAIFSPNLAICYLILDNLVMIGFLISYWYRNWQENTRRFITPEIERESSHQNLISF